MDGNRVKLADFGSCRFTNSPQPYTEYVGTRWYRSPECLLTDGYYSKEMDYWSVGCVFYELLTLKPLFPGDTEMDQIAKIFTLIGSPKQELLDEWQKIASHMDFNFPKV